MLHANIELITADTKFHAPYTHRIILLCEEKNIPYSLTEINLHMINGNQSLLGIFVKKIQRNYLHAIFVYMQLRE